MFSAGVPLCVLYLTGPAQWEPTPLLLCVPLSYFHVELGTYRALPLPSRLYTSLFLPCLTSAISPLYVPFPTVPYLCPPVLYIPGPDASKMRLPVFIAYGVVAVLALVSQTQAVPYDSNHTHITSSGGVMHITYSVDTIDDLIPLDDTQTVLGVVCNDDHIVIHVNNVDDALKDAKWRNGYDYMSSPQSSKQCCRKSRQPPALAQTSGSMY